VARYCASQLPWFTGAFFGWFCKLLEAISNLKLAYIVKVRHGEADITEIGRHMAGTS
jgi:hypothetical protein